MKTLLAMLVLVGSQLLAVPATAADPAWILSIPHAISGEGVYKVRILEIDGAKQDDLLRYAVAPGRRLVRLRMLLQVEWDPDLAEAPRGPGWKELHVVVEPGKRCRASSFRIHREPGSLSAPCHSTSGASSIRGRSTSST
jgi:hypothetical protein